MLLLQAPQTAYIETLFNTIKQQKNCYEALPGVLASECYWNM